jgi:O-antigen ligase
MKHVLYRLDIPILNQLALYSLLASGAFIILLWSPNVLGRHLTYWEKTIIYIFPWLMIWLLYSWQVFTLKALRLEIILIVSIIILGVINTALSDSVSKSIPQMRTFLLTGILALWAAMFLFTGERQHQLFDWFCAACLAIIIPVELIVWVLQEANGPEVFSVFTLNPIPLGTMIILLSSGLLALLLSPHLRVKVGGWLLTSLAGTLILFTTKRSTLLAMVAMLLGWMLLRGRRLRYLAGAVLLAVGLVVVTQGPRLVRRLDPNILPEFTLLHRLELYPFALHVWQNHPVMGIGLRPFTHQKYLADYHQHIMKLKQFPQFVTQLQTFDNMMLTGFVEFGTVMTLLYMGLVFLIIFRYYRTLRSFPGSTAIDWYRLLIILGFAVNSMTYDSLLFPPVNWLFHVQLGIMAGYCISAKASAQAPASAGLRPESSI